MQMCGGEALVKSLENEGVEVVFGLPGGAILPVYDPIIESPIRHILVRHEQGAGHMAEGYAHATGRPGVAMVTSGPAATNIVTPLCDAHLDSVPMVVITGQVPVAAIGTDAFQECDTTGITMAVTKHNFLVTDPQDIPRVVKEAFHIATTGRPGPVLVDVPKDIVDPANPASMMEWYEPTEADMELPGYRPATAGDPEAIRAAAGLIAAAEKPVLYVGGGVLKARAAEGLRELAELLGAPVATTLMARGAFPDSHELAMGMPGMHGNYTAVMSMQESDLLIAVGARFDDRVTGKVDGFAPAAKIVHIDIDAAELGKVRRPDVAIRGDCRLVIDELLVALRELGQDAQADRTAWRSTVSGWQEKYPLVYAPSEPGDLLKPQFAIETLRDNTPDDTILCSGVGQHQMFASQYWRFDHPYTWINSGGLGDHGLLDPRRHRGQGGHAGPHGLGDRRRRLLPDDRPGARHRRLREDPDQDRTAQQRLSGHGPTVAGDVLRRAVQRGVLVARPARLSEVGRGDWVVSGYGSSRPRRRPRRSPRPTRSTTARSSSSSGPIPT